MVRPLRLLTAAGLAAGLLVAPAGIVPAALLPDGIPVPALGPRPVLAAAPDLAVVSDARYVVQPEKARVHIVVDLTVTNHKADTKTRQFYFQSAYLAVLPGTTHFSATSDGTTPSVGVRSRTRSYTLLSIAFGKDLYTGQSQKLRLQFDLPDPGGSAMRDVRIGPSLAAFPVWAFASDSTPGSSVTVIFPTGYSIRVESGAMPPPVTSSSGSIVFRTGPLARPLAFYAYLSADRAAALVASQITTTVGSTPVVLTLRRWAEDPAWADRTGQLFRRGLPVLGASIGLPFPSGAPLAVEESTSRTIGGYAGLFDPATRTVQVAYYADAFVALHEAGHLWFNGRLLADRWANEAFASYYAADVADTLGLSVRVNRLTPTLEKARIPLNAWGAVGREVQPAEDYGYAASYELATLIGDRAGPGSLRAVWEAATGGEAAYQPVDETRPRERSTGGPPDWRGLLDLLEERTGVGFTDLWATWVVRPEEAPLLAARTTSRRLYESTIRAAADWELSPTIRRAMDAWQFDQAEQLLRQAREVLAERPAVEEAAGAAGLTLPPSVREAFEAPAGPGAALAELQAERAAIREIGGTGAIEERATSVLESIGIAGHDPGADLVAARAAFAGGDLRGGVEHAQAARLTWLNAEDVGRGRVLVALFAFLIVGGTCAVVVVAVARRRRDPAASAVRPGPGRRYARLDEEPASGVAAPGAPGQADAERGETDR